MCLFLIDFTSAEATDNLFCEVKGGSIPCNVRTVYTSEECACAVLTKAASSCSRGKSRFEVRMWLINVWSALLIVDTEH